MKRASYFFAAGVLALLLTACGPNSSVNGTEQEDITEEKLTGAKPDIITEENLEYYAYSRGSSSLREKFAVYAYNGDFIFAADYFNCGDELLETRLLSEEEKKLFLEEVNAVSSKTEAVDGESDDNEGAHTEYGGLVADGVYYHVEMIDFETMGLTIKDASDAEYPTKEETERYEMEGILELQEMTQWKEQAVSAGSTEFVRSVGKQIEDRSGEELNRMTIDSFGEEDFIIKAATKEGNSYIVTVTYFGYVANPEQE